ncbi:hypothetical protein FGB62_1g6112 [Gracilaria domingensis]|nr:hypothetical protein FGB62_1g6112 [Gracilaria domingensis]
MTPDDFVFVDECGDIFMPDIFMTLQIIFALAGSKGYTGVRYAQWLRRNDPSQDVSNASPSQASADLRAVKIQRQSPSPRGSPKRRAQKELGVSGGVKKGFQKLRLQRIPSHRFSRSEILDMVKVMPPAPVVRMSMMGRREASDVPSAEVSFASPEDCERVYAEVKKPLELDGIWLSPV